MSVTEADGSDGATPDEPSDAEPTPAGERRDEVLDRLALHDAATMRLELCAWFALHARDLPWRRSRDPYAIWISEAMLQQTQVARVAEYWPRFLERFPDVDSLARATDDELMAAWSGLGYYRRARALRDAAKVIAAEYGGRFPQRLDEALDLPGVGPYTAAAVLSIAYGFSEPLVDGNVERVLARVFELESAAGSAGLRNAAWRLAGRLVPPDGRGPDGPGAFNQALMELGATLCTPRNPKCLVCPWKERCRARLVGREHELPRPRVRPEPIAVELEIALAVGRDRVLVRRRPDRGRMAGLFEFPTREIGSERLWPRTWPHRDFRLREELFTLRHGITRHRIEARVHRADLWAPLPAGDGAELSWLPIARLHERPLTGIARKVLERSELARDARRGRR
ncbi:MAG: A/G-specific adenine glycosylase [Planctomycetota bacterium]